MDDEKKYKEMQAELENLKIRLKEAEDTLDAIRKGEVDAIIVSGPDGEKLYSLSTAETPYRIMVEEMSTGAVILSGEGVILFCNKAFADIVSKPIEELIGFDFRKFLNEPEQIKFNELFSKGKNEILNGEIEYSSDNKSIKYLYISFNPLPAYIEGEVFLSIIDITEKKKITEELLKTQNDLEKQVKQRTEELTNTIEKLSSSRLAMLNMMEDEVKTRKALEEINKKLSEEINERKRIEEKLKISERKYRDLVENSLVGIYSINLDGKVLFANKAFCDVLEIDTCEELPRINVKTFYKNENDRQLIIDMLKKYGKIINFEVELKTRKGKDIFVLVNCFIINDVITGMIMDISQRKHYEQQIIAAREKAEEMNRIKSSFLANMSHELRTPLQGILGFSEIIQEQENLNEVKRMAGVINKSGLRLLNTLNQILDLSLLEAKSKTVNYKTVDIVSLIKESVQLFEQEAKKKNLALTFESEINSLICLSDSEIITNILNNLISNGIIYTEHGSVTVRLKEEVIKGREYIVIDVVDTGIGIDEKHFELIFDEFRQVSEGYGRSFEGTGLGLSLCKKYLNLLGGEISVESKLGVGSDFKVKIPKIYSYKEVESEEPEEKSYRKMEKTEFKKPKILLVEDEEDCIILVEYYLREKFDVEVAKNAISAIEMVKENKYSLILMDINLGKGLSGMDAVSEIRKLPEYKNIPIVALTAFAMKGDREEFLSGGCDEYISKPFTKEKLEGVITELLLKANK